MRAPFGTGGEGAVPEGFRSESAVVDGDRKRGAPEFLVEGSGGCVEGVAPGADLDHFGSEGPLARCKLEFGAYRELRCGTEFEVVRRRSSTSGGEAGVRRYIRSRTRDRPLSWWMVNSSQSRPISHNPTPRPAW